MNRLRVLLVASLCVLAFGIYAGIHVADEGLSSADKRVQSLERQQRVLTRQLGESLKTGADRQARIEALLGQLAAQGITPVVAGSSPSSTPPSTTPPAAPSSNASPKAKKCLLGVVCR